MLLFNVLLLLVLTVQGTGHAATEQVATQPDQSGATSAASLERALLELNEKLFREYILRHNPEPFEQVALPGFTLVAPNGMMESKKQVSSTAFNLQVSSLEVINQKVIIEGNTVVLIGSLKMDGTLMGRQMPPQLTYMNVFVKSGGGWRLLSRSLTPVRDPRGPGVPSGSGVRY